MCRLMCANAICLWRCAMGDMNELREYIATRLCIRDPRNPYHKDRYPDGSPMPPEVAQCWCDNCHHGRTEMALMLIEVAGFVWTE